MKLKPLDSTQAWPVLDDILKNEYYDVLTTEDCFDVEDPDPAKRTWYYDNWGVKRKKSEHED